MIVEAAALLWCAWLLLHLWLSKAHRHALKGVVVLDLVLFAALFLWMQWQMANSDGTAGMAAGVYILIGLFLFVVPALVGLAALWRVKI